MWPFLRVKLNSSAVCGSRNGGHWPKGPYPEAGEVEKRILLQVNVTKMHKKCFQEATKVIDREGNSRGIRREFNGNSNPKKGIQALGTS